MATWKEKRTENLPQSWTKRPQSLGAEIENLKRAHATDMTMARILMRLYWNRPLMSRSLPSVVDDGDIERYALAASRVASQFGFNLLRDLIDAAAARICREMACRAETIGADSSLFQSATKMSRLIDGLNSENKTRELGEAAWIAGASGRGFGAVKAYFDRQRKELRAEWLDPMSVFFKRSQGANPQELFHQPTVPREYLQDTYPEKADAIAKVPRQHRPVIVGVEPPGGVYEDTVFVNEAWKLARGEDCPGRWVMTCGQIVLEDEPYKYDFHQIVMVRMFPDFMGAGGIALAQIGAAYHRWLNQLVRVAYESFRGNSPVVVHDSMTTINQGGVSDVPFGEMVVDGPNGINGVRVEARNVVSEQLLSFLPEIRRNAHIDTGVNEAMATGMKPPGVNSGAALREYRQDYADQRLNGPNERWAQFWSDLGKAWIGLGADHYKDVKVLVRAPGRGVLQEIKWKDVDLARDKYRLRFEVTSALSNQVAGRMQTVQDLQSLGHVDAVGAARLLAPVMPDIAPDLDRATALRELAIHMCEECLEGNPQIPSVNFGAEFLMDCVRIGTQMRARAMLMGNRTPEQMEILRKFVRAAKRRTAPPLPAAQQLQTMPAIGAGAVQPVGALPAQQQIARNRYEAASLGMQIPGQQPGVGQPPVAPGQGQATP